MPACNKTQHRTTPIAEVMLSLQYANIVHQQGHMQDATEPNAAEIVLAMDIQSMPVCGKCIQLCWLAETYERLVLLIPSQQ